MSKFKPGDRVVGPMLGEVWKFIACVDGCSYLVREKDGVDARPFTFTGELDDAWVLAPESFFEEGKRYQGKATGRLFQAIHLGTTLTGEQYAVLEVVSTGLAHVVRSGDFRHYVKL